MLSVSDGVARQRHTARGTIATRRASRSKRLIDVTVSILALIFLAPALALIAIALMIVDGRPILFRQARVGAQGEMFECLKFRSMRLDAAERLAELLASDPERNREWMEKRKLVGDPRVHWLGKVLRMTCLDELPQFYNVLRGDMSLVGPRPISPEETEKYGQNLHYYTGLKPGITGMWQVKRRPDTTYDERVQFDIEYYQSRSIYLDIVIIVKTVGVVLFATNET
ncbi:sugar transferase [Ensifer sp. Root142]|uniref:sugar transferase n=1 Tax=unclassified Ensifer TaxID=2633371 RepID=UPI000708CB76|nr:MULTISPECIES: sugar transferase [unclassified Ensifer]KQU89176.1 sugar transferase [Ensifer sp. Root31]KQY73333.1 sugar transferase [Ensifer sp. Root142]MDP9633524.1 lipopolysaccharide/colanic/teichoic acid biosynthesis glycosyltransferase [Ensifer adhaerens]